MVQKRKRFDAFHKQKIQRIEALSDGVFAITMTLLVLDVRLPLGEAIHSDHDLWQALIMLSPKLMSYILTFLVAGLFWSVYSNHYNYIHKADRNLNIISIVYLMFISLLPFSSAMLSEHPQLSVSTSWYCLHLIVISLLLQMHWMYAYHTGLTHAENDTLPMVNKAFRRRSIIALVGYITCLVGCHFGPYISLGFLFAFQLYYALGGFFVKDKKAINTTS